MEYPNDDDPCLCGHRYADHGAGGGSCEYGLWSETDDCPCMGFRETT